MLKDYLKDNKARLLQRWLDLIMDTYPETAARFLKTKSNRFANPVGSTIKFEIETLLDGLLAGKETSSLSDSVENIVKIRAVQDFAPSTAVLFVFLLKQALREVLAEKLSDTQVAEEVAAFESDIDRLALVTFDSYMNCREKIFQLRMSEIKDRSAMLQERTLRVRLEEARSRNTEDDNNLS